MSDDRRPVTCVQADFFAWTCPICGQRFTAVRPQPGQTDRCSYCGTGVVYDAVKYANGSTVVADRRPEVGET